MNLFRRTDVRYGRSPAPETPYQRAAAVWDERIGSARVQARNWRLIALGELAIVSGLALGLVCSRARHRDALGGADRPARPSPGNRTRRRRLPADRRPDRLASRPLHRGGAWGASRPDRRPPELGCARTTSPPQGRAGAERLRTGVRPLRQVGKVPGLHRNRQRHSRLARTASAWPGSSAATRTAASAPPSAGRRS